MVTADGATQAQLRLRVHAGGFFFAETPADPELLLVRGRKWSLGIISVKSAVGHATIAARHKVEFGIGQFVMFRGFDLFKHSLAPSLADGFDAVGCNTSMAASSRSVIEITQATDSVRMLAVCWGSQ
jgi:hypothetical protein